MYKSTSEGKGGIVARVVADSIAANSGKRITTLEIEYPRFIHAEFLTHRLFSRNAASSRAIPVSKVIEAVREKPAMPVHWGKNEPGMQAKEECDTLIDLGAAGVDFTAEEVWGFVANAVADYAEQFSEAGYHKQIVNRLLEPFQFMKTVVTATEFDNFFALRRHPDAQPEIMELANCMYKAMQESSPEELQEGEWHVPYVPTIRHSDGTRAYCAWVKEFSDTYETKTFEEITEEQALKVSASCCAQVSFRKSDASVGKAEKIYHMLVDSKPVHSSPFEHQALPIPDCSWDFEFDAPERPMLDGAPEGITHECRRGLLWSGNFCGWIQHRQLIVDHTVWSYDGNS